MFAVSKNGATANIPGCVSLCVCCVFACNYVCMHLCFVLYMFVYVVCMCIFCIFVFCIIYMYVCISVFCVFGVFGGIYVYVFSVYINLCIYLCMYVFVCMCLCFCVCICVCVCLLGESPEAGVGEQCCDAGTCSLSQVMEEVVAVSSQGGILQDLGSQATEGTPSSLPSHRVHTYMPRLQFCRLTG